MWKTSKTEDAPPTPATLPSGSRPTRRMRVMNYKAAAAYLLSFADFERSGRFQERPDVAPMLALLRRLGDPHLSQPTVHVAGSKGKGSVSAMVESILRASGLRTALFTSPHLHDFTERVRIDGEPISQETFARLVDEMRPAVEESQASLGERRFVTFDVLTALGFLAFRERDVNVQVIEVGLGGRVDSTNVFESKEVAVIGPLSFEHTAILGDKIEQIAAEKAAIITPGCTAVLAPQPFPEAARVVREFAAQTGVRLIDVAAEHRWSVGEHDLRSQAVRIDGPGSAVEARLPLLGRFQAENAATAVAAVEALGRDIARAAIVRGLESVRWPGRVEVLSEEPLVIADGAHNADSGRRLREALVEYFGAGRVLFIMGASSDKDIDGLAEALAPIAERVIATRAAHPRAMEPARIVEAFRKFGVPGEDVESVTIAMQRALAVSGERRLICLSGSLFVAAEGREYFGKGA
jgi:dihydrofolate synthase/folylpolyglutamate synthase